MVQQKGMTILWGYPHSAARPVLLKVNLIRCPEVHVFLCGQHLEFFYIPSEVPDRRERLPAAVSEAGIRTSEKSFGIAGPLTKC
jgi:hypothetical protein